MTCQVMWSPVVGFMMSAVVESLVLKAPIASLGAACSHASVALARSPSRTGADYTAAMAFRSVSPTWLNIVFLVLAAALVWRFFSTGGREMLTMLGGAPEVPDQEDRSAAA